MFLAALTPHTLVQYAERGRTLATAEPVSSSSGHGVVAVMTPGSAGGEAERLSLRCSLAPPATLNRFSSTAPYDMMAAVFMLTSFSGAGAVRGVQVAGAENSRD